MLALLLLVLVQLAAADPPHLVLVTMDTTRADALSCYGGFPGLLGPLPEPTTPFLDAEAAAGIRFERFYSHAPTTLSSHASMLTGLDPHRHGVPRNGFPLAPDTPALPTRLRDAGWDTIAVIGAKALEAGMGLNRGFRVYDDHTPHLRTLMHQDTAESVVDRALTAVDARIPDKPLFLWVHLYDPHAPYEAPPPWRHKFTVPGYTGRYANDMQNKLAPLRSALARGRARPEDIAQVNGLYLGEVAYMDAQIARLNAGLAARGLLDHALVVYVADHGETLHDVVQDAYSHGTDVEEGAMRVPHIWRAHGLALPAGRVVRRQAGMSGLAATIEQALGLPNRLGPGFWDLVRPGPVRDEDGWPARPTWPVPMEATRPNARASAAGAFNNLALSRGLHAGGFTLRASPWREIAPALATPAPVAARDLLTRLLQAWDAIAPGWRSSDLSDDTRDALRALGYLDGAE